MERKNKEPRSFGLNGNGDDSDKSSGNESPFSTRSSSSSSDTSSDSSVEKEPSSEAESLCIPSGSYDQFVQKTDANASLDDQGCDLMAKIADAFVNDVSMRMVKLAKHRKSRVGLLDLEFVLKREYNMEFPNEHNAN
ncbi:transcription initiation factor TFIID subunit 12 isoform X2 [Drosophila gunungcola]|uniref:transcription initiation factor TFIID subunit 12 isoform X2 n=1 Tax=Drosophila elegans TaxID=30023 RepID=UPI0007E77487|nr:transcription initiation factor TFIID subunit 12 isoform X2 [Drosophila elegans]XP_052852509.1 transcription initiation factor TFIID subunit 12 isoform X2 [Drosophila gunungcola]